MQDQQPTCLVSRTGLRKTCAMRITRTPSPQDTGAC